MLDLNLWYRSAKVHISGKDSPPKSLGRSNSVAGNYMFHKGQQSPTNSTASNSTTSSISILQAYELERSPPLVKKIKKE